MQTQGLQLQFCIVQPKGIPQNRLLKQCRRCLDWKTDSPSSLGGFAHAYSKSEVDVIGASIDPNQVHIVSIRNGFSAVKVDNPTITPRNFKVIALLMAVLGMSTVNAMLFEFDIARRGSWVQIPIAAAWSIGMIVVAIGLWKGQSWGLRLCLLTLNRRARLGGRELHQTGRIELWVPTWM